MTQPIGQIPLVAVVGPTASGKTELAVEIALRYGGEVVSADSMQVYRGMDIGTAKPTREEMRGVPHHMIDVADPQEDFSVAEYVEMARRAVADIHARGRLPVVAGGTGLYIDSLLHNVRFDEAAPRDDALREELQERARREGGEALLETLRGFDPETAARLHPHNLGRVIRAIEVYRLSGVTMSELQRRSRREPSPYRALRVGLEFPDRAVLYGRINRRVDRMMAAGLADEVRALLATPGVRGSTAMQAIGYKEIARAVDGETTLEEAVEAVKLGTRRYAKRQMTWFKRDRSVVWLGVPPGKDENICKQAGDVIDKSSLLWYNN